MRDKTTYFLTGLGIILILGSILYYFLRPEPPAVDQQVTQLQQDNRVTFSGNRITDMENGRLSWEISADYIEAEEASKLIKLNKIAAVVYRESGTQIQLTGMQGIFNTATSELTITGEVKISDTEGTAFTAPKVLYKTKEKLFYGFDGIKIIKSDAVIHGDTVTCDNNFGKIQVKGNAKVVKGGSQQ